MFDDHANQANGHRRRNVPTPQQGDRAILLMTGLSVAIAFLFSSFYPSEVAIAVFSTVLVLSAIATVFIAMLTLQRPRLDRLNLWDKAAILAFLGIGIGMLVDQDAMRAFIEQQQALQAADEVPAPAAVQQPLRG